MVCLRVAAADTGTEVDCRDLLVAAGGLGTLVVNDVVVHVAAFALPAKQDSLPVLAVIRRTDAGDLDVSAPLHEGREPPASRSRTLHDRAVEQLQPVATAGTDPVDVITGERAKAQAAAAELTDNFRSFAMNLLPPEQVEPAVQLLLRCQKSAGQEILAELARLREARAVPHCLYARLGQCGMPEGLGSDDQATWLEQYLRQRQDDCANVKAENARLREALKPFAARWRKLVHDYGEKHFEGRNETEVMVNVNHLKAAAAALSPAPPIGKIDIHLDAVSGKGIPQTGDER